MRTTTTAVAVQALAQVVSELTAEYEQKVQALQDVLKQQETPEWLASRLRARGWKVEPPKETEGGG